MEVMVTVVLVSVALVGTLGAIRSIKDTDAKAQTADLLQRLAAEKISDLKLLQDPSTAGTDGDSERRNSGRRRWLAEYPLEFRDCVIRLENCIVRYCTELAAG